MIDMTRAYPRGTVRQLVRTLTLESDANRLFLEDAYTFSRSPKSLEEAFITFEKAAVARNGRSVQIGSRSNGMIITPVDVGGTFSIERLEEAARVDGKGDQVITRIAFVPDNLKKRMTLRFEIG